MTDPDELNDVKRRVFTTPQSPVEPSCWQPPADIYQLRDGWLVKVELAGIQPEALEIKTAGRTLVIRGRRCDRLPREGLIAYSMEIAYSRFQRILDLPADLDRLALASEYRDGMLLIRISE